MGALPDLVTVAQFRQLPEPGGLTYELHHGEVVAVTRPRKGHIELQMQLADLLGPRLRRFGRVVVECPYRPIAEFEYRVADVAAVARARWDAVDPDDDLRGAPELVIEVKSPSNSPAHLRELASLVLVHGAIQCWIVDPDQKSVTVIHPDGTASACATGSEVPLAEFGAGALAVDEIFAA